MLKLQSINGRFYYSIFLNPMPRVMKFDAFFTLFDKLPNAEIVVDYGAGDQPLKPLLKTKYSQYIPADYAPANAEHALRPEIEIADNKLNLPDNYADCVVLTEVMEHLYDPRAALDEIYRILKPGGYVVGTVPFAIGEHEQPYDFHRYTLFCLKAIFEDSHFKVTSLKYIGDGIGVLFSSLAFTMGIIPKALNKLKLKFLANTAWFIIRIPGMLYYGLQRIGLSPQRIKYYQNYPLGFAFMIQKPVEIED